MAHGNVVSHHDGENAVRRRLSFFNRSRQRARRGEEVQKLTDYSAIARLLNYVLAKL